MRLYRLQILLWRLMRWHCLGWLGCVGRLGYRRLWQLLYTLCSFHLHTFNISCLVSYRACQKPQHLQTHCSLFLFRYFSYCVQCTLHISQSSQYINQICAKSPPQNCKYFPTNIRTAFFLHLKPISQSAHSFCCLPLCSRLFI